VTSAHKGERDSK